MKKEHVLLLPKREKYISGGVHKDVKYTINTQGCFICTSHFPLKLGYFSICINKRVWKMHRFVYYNYKGEIPEGLVVRHTCDNNRCINPDHLITGTSSENRMDCIQRGRANIRVLKGEESPVSKLTEKDVLEIRGSGLKRSVLAEKYGVGKLQISRIRLRKSWAHIL